MTTIAFAVEIAVDDPNSADFDPVKFGGEIVRDAIAGWGINVTRLVHLANPDDIFPS